MHKLLVSGLIMLGACVSEPQAGVAEAIAKGCYHCTTTCFVIDGADHDTDYTSCGVSSNRGARDDATAACWNQGYDGDAPGSTTCTYVGPDQSTTPSTTSTAAQ